MKRKIICFATVFLSLYMLTQTASAATLLIPGGEVVGMRLQDDTVTVTDIDPNIGQAAISAGLQSGDRLIAIDGNPIHCVADVQTALQNADGTVRLSVQRDGKTKAIALRPTDTENGKKLGVYLRQGTTGLGTVTYYTPDGDFGALGHGINDTAGKLLTMTDGDVYSARISGVKKGKIGTPGQLLGTVTDNDPAGSLDKNTAQGVFGEGISGKTAALPAAESGQIRPGKATIRSTVAGSAPKEYSVEILKIYANTGARSRNLLLKVTDPALLTATGGIVQGMSGSPIIQDGKLVGAVTHVLVNDPTMGYGIFIENMLDAAA